MKSKFRQHYTEHQEAWMKNRVPPLKRKRLHVKWLAESVQEFYKAGGGQLLVQRYLGDVDCAPH